MITDRKRLVARKTHKSRNDVNALFPVTVGELVVDGVEGNTLPNTVFLDVSGGFNVKIHLAKIVKKRNDGNALVGVVIDTVNLLHTRTLHNVLEALVNI